MQTTTTAMLKADKVDVPVRVRLAYDPKEPYAVVFAFRAGNRGEIRWMFGRELLLDGLASRLPVGEGDVRLWLADDDTLRMGISSPDGSAWFDFDAEPVAGFLAELAAETPGEIVIPDSEYALLLGTPQPRSEDGGACRG